MILSRIALPRFIKYSKELKANAMLIFSMNRHINITIEPDIMYYKIRREVWKGSPKVFADSKIS